MVYFSNSSEGKVLQDDCARCKLGDTYCPINNIVFFYNYEQCNNQLAKEIIDTLVNKDGCVMLREADVLRYEENI